MQHVTHSKGVSVATVTTLAMTLDSSYGDGRANRLDIKITPPGLISAEPHGNGGDVAR